MTSIYSSEDAVARLHALPKTTQEFIYSEEMGDILTKIGEKHGLHLDQLGNLEHEVVSFILGFIEPEDFNSNIAESLEVAPDTAASIAKDVDELLLSKIRKDMENSIPQEQVHSIETAPTITSSNTVINPNSEEQPVHTTLPLSVDTALSTPVTQRLPKIDSPVSQELTPPQTHPESAYKTDPYREPIE